MFFNYFNKFHLFKRSIQADERLNVLFMMMWYILDDTDEDVGDRCIVIPV